MSEVVEMNIWESLVKLNERLTFFILNVKNKSDKGVTDEDYAMVKPIVRDIWNGELVFYKTVLDVSSESVTEQGLFADKTSDSEPENCVGTELDNTEEETNKNETK